jgi:hypothetical protein
MADDDNVKKDIREGKTEPDEDEYGKVGSGDDADGDNRPQPVTHGAVGN